MADEGFPSIKVLDVLTALEAKAKGKRGALVTLHWIGGAKLTGHILGEGPGLAASNVLMLASESGEITCVEVHSVVAVTVPNMRVLREAVAPHTIDPADDMDPPGDLELARFVDQTAKKLPLKLDVGTAPTTARARATMRHAVQVIDGALSSLIIDESMLAAVRGRADVLRVRDADVAAVSLEGKVLVVEYPYEGPIGRRFREGQLYIELDKLFG